MQEDNNELLTEIELLKAENDELKAENESLKGHLAQAESAAAVGGGRSGGKRRASVGVKTHFATSPPKSEGGTSAASGGGEDGLGDLGGSFVAVVQHTKDDEDQLLAEAVKDCQFLGDKPKLPVPACLIFRAMMSWKEISYKQADSLPDLCFMDKVCKMMESCADNASADLPLAAFWLTTSCVLCQLAQRRLIKQQGAVQKKTAKRTSVAWLKNLIGSGTGDHASQESLSPAQMSGSHPFVRAMLGLVERIFQVKLANNITMFSASEPLTVRLTASCHHSSWSRRRTTSSTPSLNRASASRAPRAARLTPSPGTASSAASPAACRPSKSSACPRPSSRPSSCR
jgi:hypothetical protein